MQHRIRLIKRFLGIVYSSPRNGIERLDEIVKSQRCIKMAGARLYLSCSINNRQPRSSIVIGCESRILARFETYRHGGKIIVGDHCFIGQNTYLWSASEIRVGNRVLISHDVNIHDTNSHSLSAARRHEHFKDIFSRGAPIALDDIPTRPIMIEDDAWIGFGATVLKGVTVGRGAIVAARSLVTKDVPPYTIVAGSPAREIGHSLP